ncbi:hypothetical protein ACFL03_12560 [Thermodesulfobacteriota bacterium]
MKLISSKALHSLAMVVGTFQQQRIAREIIPLFKAENYIHIPTIVSLDGYYQFGLKLDNLGPVMSLNSIAHSPWYDRPFLLKLCSLLPFIFQMFLISRRFSYVLFFVDTGALERTAIIVLKRLGCRTIVLQDAMKRKPRYDKPGSLTWFGSGGADLYLLTGKRYLSMVQCNRSTVVGSPIYSNQVIAKPLGNKILVINQCFARYGEMSVSEEVAFAKKVVENASAFGPVELKLHPHNNPREYSLLRRPGVEVTQHKPLSRSLEDAGIVLSVNSTVILEALVLGRPVLTLDWHPSPFEQPVRTGITRCESLNEMCKALNRWRQVGPKSLLFPIQAVQQEVEEFIAYSGNDAKMRIAKAIERFVIETYGQRYF